MVFQKVCNSCNRVFDYNLIKSIDVKDGIENLCPFCYTDRMIQRLKNEMEAQIHA